MERWELETNPAQKIELWNEFEAGIHSAKTTNHETIIIDSIDRVETICRECICEQEKVKSLEKIPFGKGWVMLAERLSRLLGTLDRLIDCGKNVVVIAHSKVQRVEPPDLMAAYDRYELKLHKQCSPLVKEWADELWFFRFKTKSVTNDGGKAKGIGGKERVIYTTHSAAYDAKTRSGLPDEIPMEWSAVAHLFQPVAKPKTSEPAVEIIGRESVAVLEDNEEIVNAFLLANGSLTEGQTWRDANPKLRQQIVARPEALVAKAKAAQMEVAA